MITHLKHINMKLENKELQEEYYKEITDKYPGLTLEECKEICTAPWRFLKQEVESGELPEVRFKYFGTFQVYQGRAELMLYNLKQRFKLHKIDVKQYYKLKDMLEKHLKRLKDEQEV